MYPGVERVAHCSPEPARAAGAPAPPAASTATALRPLVLAVDDDAVQRTLLQAVLQQAGFDVVVAADGDEATALAIDLRPDVIVTDALMPHTSGLEMIARLRSRLGNVRVPTIVVSGTSDIATRLDAFEIGADDFVAKPYDSAELVARVNAQLRAANHWTTQANAVLAELRSVRQRTVIGTGRGAGTFAGDGEPVETRFDSARRIFADRPSALACASVAIADRTTVQWIPRPTIVDWSILAPAVQGLSASTPTVDIAVGPDDRCPLCGAAGEGRLSATVAARWSTGAAYVLVGCQSPARPTHRVLAEELANAIGRVLDESPDRAFADDHARRWIDEVIAGRQYRFVFQPIVTLRTRRVVGYEALVRFGDGLDPIEVLRLASDAGRRVELELALARGAVDAAGVFPEGTWIHVNVSPLAALAPEVAALVRGSRQRIVLEITEDALFDADGATGLRAALPASCRLAIDDVGAGYAGLSRLLDVRPDIVKIDREVIRGVDGDPARQALVAGLVQFGNVTDAMVIAEGIEHEAERDVLYDIGVRYAQGYLFAHPGAPNVTAAAHPVTPPVP